MSTSADTISQSDRAIGCLVGGAIGDALGAPVEFWGSERIREAFGAQGVRDYRDAGHVTDDTQMTLFTVEGILRAFQAQGAGSAPSPATTVAHVHDAYLRWLQTQESSSPPAVPTVASAQASDLITQPWLHALRAPGTTCLSALRASREDASERRMARNDSKGCGGVMRSAPFGLIGADDPGSLAMACAGITHGHVTGQVASGALAVLIDALARGSTLDAAISALRTWLDETAGSAETAAAVHAALGLAESARPGQDSVELLGGGWIAEEALAIGLYAAVCHPGKDQIREALALSVTHGGDSDSTGSICGNILGTLHGAPALPPDLRQGLEGLSVIEQLAVDLTVVAEASRPSATGVQVGSSQQRRGGN